MTEWPRYVCRIELALETGHANALMPIAGAACQPDRELN